MIRGRLCNSHRISRIGSWHMGAWVSLAAISFTAPLMAAEAEVANLDEVVVTGFRASLNKALEVKRESTGAVDAIVAEDIADFPDSNLSESIQRIPGVALDRDAGEGRRISVRGLGPQFTRVRINGMEAVATTGSTDASGGTNRTRAFDFNVFASDLFNSITVRKTASADVEEGSLGATVDLQVARPFDYSGLTLVVSGQASYNDLAKKVDPRGTFLVSNLFADNTLGWLFSAAYTRRHLEEEGASTVRWQSSVANSTAVPAATARFQTVPAGFTANQLSSAFRPRIPRYGFYTHDQERIGLTTSLQFRPTDATELTLDVLYASIDAERTEAFLEAPNFSANIDQVDVLDAQIDGTNTLIYGRFDDVDVRSEQRFDTWTTDFVQFTLSGKQTLSDTLTLNGLIGYSDSAHENPIQTTLLWDRNDMDGYVYDYRGNSQLPYISYGNNNVADPSFWTLSQIRLRPQTADNTFSTLALDLKWDMSDSLALSGGVQLKKFTFETTERRRSNGTTANQEGVIPASVNSTTIPNASYASQITVDSVNAPAGTTLSWAVPNLDAAARLMNLYNESAFPMGIESVLGNNYGIEEKDTGVFTQLDFKTHLGPMPLRGNIGIRYVKTKQTSRGFAIASSGLIGNSASQDYSDTLPSMNLVLDVTDDLLIRAAAAKVMSRPGLSNLSNGIVASVSGANFTVTSGEPNLDPDRATTYDLGVEWYFAKEASLGLGLFYKDIKSYVQTIRTNGVFSANPWGLPDSVAIAACGTTVGCAPGSNWQFNFPANTPGGPLKGAEVSFQTPFTFLPGIWSNFGTILNYTYVDAEIQYVSVINLPPIPPNTVPVPTIVNVAKDSLLNLSSDAFNATLYFDNGTFSARVAAAYRSEYRTAVPGQNNGAVSATDPSVVLYGNNVQGTAATTTIDFSTSYNLNDHLSVSLEALNLTDEFQDQWIDSNAKRNVVYHHTGRTFSVGARYKF